jgi:FkbM family methyltransferase
MSEPPAGMQALQQQLAELRTRVEDIARVVTAGYHENLFWLRKIHNSSAVYLGDNVAMTFLANGCRAYIDTRSRDVGVHLMHGGVWETSDTEAFKRLLRPGARVVDVGANLGWYSLVAAPLIGAEGRLYAVEPNPELAALVQASLRTNGFGGFSTVFQVAVGDAPGVVELVSRPAMSGGGFIREFRPALGDRPPEGTRVASMRLDDLLSKETQPDGGNVRRPWLPGLHGGE